MNVTKLVTVTDAVLLSSNVLEDDHPVWNAATSYTVGDLVIRTETHRIYENLIAGVNATTPEVAAEEDVPRWLDIGPTNKWAVFDREIGSTTKRAGSIQYVFQPGVGVNTVGLIEIVNASSVTVSMKDEPGGTEIYSKTVDDLDGATITDFYDFFFEPVQQLDKLVFSDLPGSFDDCEITVTVEAGGDAEVGVILFGPTYNLGDTEFGVQLGILDFSRKTTNEFGRVTVTKRRFSSTVEARQMFSQSALNRVYRLLAELRSEPCLWVGTSAPGYESLIVYGFYANFSVDLAFPTINYCTLRLESLT